MNKEWIEDWRDEVGKEYIKLHGSTSTSKNLDVALGFSQCHKDFSSHQQPVLFVYSIRNYEGFDGFRLNSKRYSVYPGEQEYLLMEGFIVYVLGIEDKFTIKNKFLAKYNSKTVTVIYLQDYEF